MYAYRARRANGQTDRGTIDAPSEQDALKRLRSRDLIVSDLRPAGRSFTIPLLNGVGLKDRIIFAEQLSLMLHAGIPLARALTDLESQTSNRSLTKIIRALTADIKGGVALSEALAKHPAAFPPLMVSMIRSGEASGKLVEVLERVTEQMQKDADLRGKIKSAMLYPAIILVAIVGVLALIIIFIIPQLKTIFDDAAIELPAITRAILALADFLTSYALVILLLVGILAAVGGWLIKQPGPGLAYDRYKLYMPVFGALSRKVSIARMATTAATLLSAGLPVLEVLKISRDVIGNRYYEKELERITRAAETGTTLSTAIRHGGVFPTIVPNLIAVGEESGKLDETFGAVADFFNREVEATTRNLTTLLEPMIMLMMGAGVGLVVASVLMPIYKLIESI